MTDRHPIEREASALLSASAPARAPDRLYADVVTSIGHTRQRTRWLACLKESPMRTPSGVAVGSPTLRLISVALLTLALALMGAAAVATGASLLQPPAVLPAPYGPADNGTIAFERDGDIWVADASGTDPRLLIGGPADDSAPVYSRDGTHLAFERLEPGQRPRLMVAAADGTDVRAVAEISVESWGWDWSPDDTRILAGWEVGGKPVLSIIALDGSQPVQALELGQLRPFGFAAWRPQDGREIIFTASDTDGSRGLFAVTPDGSEPRRIGEASMSPDSFQSPVVSPGGETVVYWEFVHDTEYGAYLRERDIATGVDAPLSLDPSFPGAGLNPRFTPDGTSLLFESGPHDEAFVTGENVGQLVVAPVDGSAPAKPLGHSYPGSQPWIQSPDGTQVLQDRATEGVWMIDIRTGDETRTSDGLTKPTWQRLAH